MGAPASEGAGQTADPPSLDSSGASPAAADEGSSQELVPSPASQLLEQAEQHAAEYDWKQLAEVVGTLATLSLSPGQAAPVLQLFQSEVVRRLRQGKAPASPSRVSLILLSLAQLKQQPSADFLSAVTEFLVPHLHELQPQSLADVIGSFASLGYYPGASFFTDLDRVLHSQLPQCSLQQLSRTLAALAVLRHHPGMELLERLCFEAKRHIPQSAVDDICNLLWAAAMLGGSPSIMQLISPLVERLQLSSTLLPARELGRALWAFASTGLLSEEVATVLKSQEAALEGVDAETLQQVAAAYCALPALAKWMPQSLLVQAVTTRSHQVASSATSQAAKDMVTALRDLGLESVEAFTLEQGLLRADVALPASKIAFAIDGEESFCVNQPKQPLGSTILNWRLLAARGWKLVSVPEKDWARLQGSEQRASLLRQVLQGPSALEAHQLATLKLPGLPVPSPSASTMDASIDTPAASADSSVHSRPGPAGVFQGSAATASSSGSSNLDSVSRPAVGEQNLPGLPGIPPRLPSLIDVLQSSASAAGRASGGGVPRVPSSELYGSLNLPGPSGAGEAANLPALTQLNKPAALDTGAYWDQVALASRLAAMRIVPQAPLSMPPMTQPGHGLPDGPLADLSAKLAASSSNTFPQDPTPGLSGTIPQDLPGIRAPASLQLPALGGPNFLPGIALGGPAGLGPPMGAVSNGVRSSPSQGDLRQLWQMVTQVEPGQGYEGQEGVSVAELKRVIEVLPLETSAVNAVAPRLALLDPPQFASLLTELARDNHAFRAWQLFDWVRALPEDNDLRRLCDSNTYTTMISLCGPWQQVRRALSLVADMRARSLECGIQAYSALLNAAVKCGEVELAVDVYHQMGREGMTREKHIFQTMVDVFVKMGRHAEALGVLDEMKKAGQPAEVQLYNLIVLSCTKLNNPRAALDVYRRMAEDGVQPNTKTFTALISSVGKMSTLDQALDIIDELLSPEKEPANLTQTYSALMSACEKAGQWDLAVALFDKMSAQGCQPDVSIFNSMIAACAHGGEFNKARLMFERMAEHSCAADAVTYANLIRAYKKGGQWCHALDTFEAMQRSGCRPHAAVFSSIIDVLWQTGISWAQAKALRLFASAVENGSLAGAAESSKKGTLKVDLQALTVGVAVLSMAAWLSSARQALIQDQAGPLDSSRKLAVVNGLGEHSRAQGHSAAVKEAVGAGLLGCKAPFRLVQDHSRSGRLEASSLALRKWLFSDAFDAYINLLQGGGQEPGGDGLLPSTQEYLEKEVVEAAKCQDLFLRIQKYEQIHPVSLKVLHSHPGPYLAVRKQLVSLTLHYAAALQLSQETAHTALALMDRCVMSGVHLIDHLHTLLVCACVRVAAVQESAFLPSPLAIQALTNIPGIALERMEANIAATLNNDTECISAVHCLKIYLQRLGVDLGDGDAVRRAAGCAFALATQALAELPILHFPPSLTAAAVLVAARKAQGSVPFWPSVLSQLTGYTEASTPAFASAIGHAERLCTKLCNEPAGAFGGGGSLPGGG